MAITTCNMKLIPNPMRTPVELALFTRIPSKNTPPKLPMISPSTFWNWSQSDLISIVAIRNANSMPTMPMIRVACLAILSWFFPLLHPNLKWISVAYAVAAEFMLLLKLLIAAAKMAAINSPARPEGSWDMMYHGKIASLLSNVGFSSPGNDW